MRRAAPWALIALLATLPFLGGLRGGFIGDDVPIVRENPGLRADGDPLAPFGETYWRDTARGGLYRPLTVTSFRLDRVLWGAHASGAPDPLGSHLTNLVLHALAASLVLVLATPRVGHGAALLAAALFAVHPAHVEAVVHLVGRADLLCAVLALGSWALWRPASLPRRGAAAVLFLAALLSKEMAAALPLVLLVETVARGPRRPVSGLVARAARELWPLALAGAVWLAVRGAVLGASLDPPRAFAPFVPGQYLAFRDPAPLEVPLTMVHAFGEYLRLFLLPLELSADYSGFPHHVAPDLAVVVSALAWLALAVACAVAARRGEPGYARWLVIFLLWMLPVSNLIAVSGIVMAERALYLPSVALCAAAGLAASRLAERARAPRAVLGVAAAVVLALAARSAARAPVWRDAPGLYETTVASRFAGPVAWNGYAGESLQLFVEGRAGPERLARALDLARRAAEAISSRENLHNLAAALELSGELDEALRTWQRLRRVDPGSDVYRDGVLRLLERRAVEAERRGELAAAAADLARGRALARGTEREGAWVARADAFGAGAVDAALAAGRPLEALEVEVALAPAGAAPSERVREAAREAGTAAELAERFRRARDAGDAPGAATAVGLLARLEPESELVAEELVPALERALRSHVEAGRGAATLEVARELLRADPDHPLARAALDGRSDP